MSYRKNNPIPVVYYLAFAAAGLVTYLLLKPRASKALSALTEDGDAPLDNGDNSDPTDVDSVLVNYTPPPHSGYDPPQTETPAGEIPIEDAKRIQESLERLSIYGWNPSMSCSPLSDNGYGVTYDGIFGRNSASYLIAYRPIYAQVAEYARDNNIGRPSFFAVPSVFYDPIPSDTITLKIHNRVETVTIRRSLYDLLCSELITEEDDVLLYDWADAHYDALPQCVVR